MTNTRKNIAVEVAASEEADDNKNLKYHYNMAKSNEQLEDILDDLSVIKNNNVVTEQKLSNIENLLAKLATKEEDVPITPVASTSAASIPYDEIKSAVHEEMDSYFNAMSDSTELLSNKTLKRLGAIFIELYAEEIDKFLEKDEKERERKRSVYMQKRKAQGLMTIEQVAEWAPQYSLEIQRTIRYIGMKIIDENESVEKAHAILKIWGDALQTITSPRPSPPPTLKSWWFYRWNRFKQRTDKWRLLQWYLVILGIIACVLFSSLDQNWVMDLDRTNRIFYKKVIIDEKRKKNYQELDSLIHSDSFFKTYWNLNN